MDNITCIDYFIKFFKIKERILENEEIFLN